SRGNQIGPLTRKDKTMELTPEELANIKSLAAVAPKLMALAAAPVQAAATTQAAAPVATAEKQDEGAQATAQKTEEELKTDATEKATAEPQLIEQRDNDSLELREQARAVLGAEAVLTGKSNRDIMVEVIKHVDSKFELGNRDETYLRARFDGALQHHADKQS